MIKMTLLKWIWRFIWLITGISVFLHLKSSRHKYIEYASNTSEIRLGLNNIINESQINQDADEELLWLQNQELRVSHLEEECQNIRMDTTIPSLEDILKTPRNKLSNMIIDDRHKLIYCYIPKVACTEWKKLMMVLTGVTPVSDLDSLSHSHIHYNNKLRFMNQLTDKTYVILEKLRSYKKFMIVRHPLERLLSAFKDKFTQNNSDANAFKRYHAVSMMRQVRAPELVSETGEGLTFSEFLQYLILQEPKSNQEHWKPYLYLCHPCVLQYDFIGKYDTIEEDSNWLLERLNISSDIRFPQFKPSSTKKKLPQYLANVSQEIIQEIVNRFSYDFRLFNYTTEWSKR